LVCSFNTPYFSLGLKDPFANEQVYWFKYGSTPVCSV